MALLATKKKIQLATKGHKLLKEKRDALISEFFKIIDELKAARQRVEEELAEAYKALILAQAVNGIAEVERAAETTKPVDDIPMRHHAIMGVRVPVFSWDARETKVTEKGYSLLSSSTHLDDAAQRFERALNSVIKIAEQEETVRRLGEEIKKTKRKVNALERILIPKLDGERIYITQRLEEMERENFGRLKVIKSKIS